MKSIFKIVVLCCLGSWTAWLHLYCLLFDCTDWLHSY